MNYDCNINEMVTFIKVFIKVTPSYIYLRYSFLLKMDWVLVIKSPTYILRLRVLKNNLAETVADI